jgi:hypothetical protein
MSVMSPTSALQKRRATTFGPNDELVGVINDGDGVASHVGAVMWSMGWNEMKIARRLGARGIASLQVKHNQDQQGSGNFRPRKAYGVDVGLCRAAMDKLARDRSVSSFLLMGNCGFANICIRTATADPRVVALILTNPHVAKEDAARVERSFLRRRLFRLGNWKRFFSGRTDLRANLDLLRVILGGKHRDVDRSAPARKHLAAPRSDQDIVMPKDIDEQLQKLCDRGVKILIACATGDVSFHYLRAFHRATFRELEKTGRLTFVPLEVDAHNLATDEAAENALHEVVARWVETDF